jgi:hypothetical protein
VLSRWYIYICSTLIYDAFAVAECEQLLADCVVLTSQVSCFTTVYVFLQVRRGLRHLLMLLALLNLHRV